MYNLLFEGENAVSNRKRALLIFLPVAVVIMALVSLCVGSTGASAWDGIRDAFAGNTQSAAYRILMFVRLPRTLGALFAGMAFSVSGVLIQSLLYNPLAGPNIIGRERGRGVFCGAGAGAVARLECGGAAIRVYRSAACGALDLRYRPTARARRASRSCLRV